jgi:hypothetical protein
LFFPLDVAKVSDGNPNQIVRKSKNSATEKYFRDQQKCGISQGLFVNRDPAWPGPFVPLEKRAGDKGGLRLLWSVSSGRRRQLMSLAVVASRLPAGSLAGFMGKLHVINFVNVNV